MKSDREFYEDYYPSEEVYWQGIYWDVGAWCTRKAVRDKITRTSGFLLDLGAGLGTSLVDISGFRKVGLEYALSTIMKALRHRDSETQFVNGDAQHLPFASESFEVIISQHVLEHIPDDQQVVDECYRVLKSRGGELIFFVPGSLTGEVSQRSFEKNRHLRHYNAARFRELFGRYDDFTIEEIYLVHRAHNLIWNRIKRLFPYPNFLVKKLTGDNKSYFERQVYRTVILPFFVTILDFLDSKLHAKENLLPGLNYNVLVRCVKQ